MVRRRTTDWVSAALIGLPIVGFVVMAWSKRWTHDDGFITLRVVDQVFAGHGPVYNSGQRVEAFTSPLHLFLLVVARALFGWALNEAWLGVILTIGGAVAGLLGAVAGSAVLARASGAKGRLLPLGILVPVALPPMWEYATAGLETGIAIGWIGISFWLLARVATADRKALDPPRLWPVAIVVGLGPLVRPEGLILSVAFVAVLAASHAAGPDRRRRLSVVAVAAALPLAYEVFRMGYYGTLVPNTALAKAAGGSRWGQGWYYLVNFAGPYLLVVPLVVFGAWLAVGRRWSITRTFGGSDGRNLVAATVAGAALQALYVVRVGGDYMHARMLLMPMFALCCPLAVVVLPRAARASTAVVACVATLGGWAALVSLAQRPPHPESFFGGHSIAEQRVFYAKLAGNPHPVTLDEWSGSYPYRIGEEARQAHAAGRDQLITAVGFGGITLPPVEQLPEGSGAVLFLDGIGVAGERAGVDVPVIDLHGLADPIASRVPILHPRELPGHEKVLPQSWALAEAGVRPGDPLAGSAPLALHCGDVGRLLRAIDGPITPARFLRNLVDAPGFTTLVIPKEPDATASACH